MYSALLKNLCVRLNGALALEEVSFSAEHPTFLSVIGPNGAGKTTLLKAMMGLIRPFSGTIKVLGLDPIKDGSALRRVVGYVPQRDRITREVPMKVKEVVLMGLVARKSPPRTASQWDVESAKEALRLVGLEDLWNKPFSELSGGQQQRVLIARCLAFKPKLLLLDEPFSGVDIKTQLAILGLLRRLKDEHEASVFLVAHDINPLVDVSEKILLLNRRVVAYGRPKEVLTEEKLREVYGGGIKVVTYGDKCFAITGDAHA